jgi:hypothetical protein
VKRRQRFFAAVGAVATAVAIYVAIDQTIATRTI